MWKCYYLGHWVVFSHPQKHPDGILKKRLMSSPSSKIITVLAPGKAFYAPKRGILSSKWLPPLKAGLITHQLLIPLAYFCILCLWLGNWARKAPIKLNLPSQPIHFSVLQFNCEMWWHTYMSFFCVTVMPRYVSRRMRLCSIIQKRWNSFPSHAVVI